MRDLKTLHKMQPVTDILFAAIEENYQRLRLIVEGMNQQLLDFKGSTGTENSIAQLIKHLSYVDILWLYRFKDERLPEHLEIKYGPMLDLTGEIPLISEVSLHVLLEEYDQVIIELKDFCLRLSDSELERIVDYDGEQVTIRWGLWHLADHSRYHQAHINMLNKQYK